MKFIALIFLSISFLSADQPRSYFLKNFNRGIVLSQKEITLPGVDFGFNPSMIEYGEHILMIFRYQPNIKTPWISYVALVLLDFELSICGDMQILDLRGESRVPSRAEDGRLFLVNDKIFIIYNDNVEPCEGAPSPNRQMYLAEIIPDKGRFTAGKPLLLKRGNGNYPVEKNWAPFVYNEELYLEYSLQPHEILKVDLDTGFCPLFAKSSFTKVIDETHFSWTKMRGGTPALRIGNEYLAFFHSSDIIYSEVSRLEKIYHYFTGAYLFSAAPPFAITKISPVPIVGKNFYTQSPLHKRVVFPTGYILKGDNIYLCFGKDDSKMVIATLSLNKLLSSLINVKSDQINYLVK